MANYRTVRRLSPIEAGYIAGLIDGEGSIHLTRRHKKDQRQLAITISNTERDILVYVVETVGAGRITSKLTYLPTHAPSYAYAILNRQALDLLTQITRFMHSYKAARAKLILDNYIRLTPRNGKYTASLLAERADFIKAFFSITARGIPSNRLTAGV